MTYTIIYGPDTKLQTILRSDGANIPPDPMNSDYQKFLKDNGGPPNPTGAPTIPVVIPKPEATVLQSLKALSGPNQQAILNDLLTRLLIQNPDIAAKYGITVTQ